MSDTSKKEDLQTTLIVSGVLGLILLIVTFSFFQFRVDPKNGWETSNLKGDVREMVIHNYKTYNSDLHQWDTTKIAYIDLLKYDTLGNLLFIKHTGDSLFLTIRIEVKYDHLNRVVKTKQVSNKGIYRTQYHINDNLQIRQMRATPGDDKIIREEQYDKRNRLLKSFVLRGQDTLARTVYHYDNLDRNTLIEDYRGSQLIKTVASTYKSENEVSKTIHYLQTKKKETQRLVRSKKDKKGNWLECVFYKNGRRVSLDRYIYKYYSE